MLKSKFSRLDLPTKLLLVEYPFMFVRLMTNVLIVQPEKTSICFFIDNAGNQIPNPKTNQIYPYNIEVWGDETAGEKQIKGCILFGDNFISNIIRIIIRLEDHVAY
jgi:hypothetical protein